MNPSGPKTSLTEQEVKFFRTFGFIILRQHFTPDEMGTINDEFKRVFQAKHGGLELDSSRQNRAARREVHFLDDSTPFLTGLPENPKFFGIAAQLYGEDLIGHAATGLLYDGNTPWHPDSHYPNNGDRWGIKFGIYTEAIDGESGALRVIPGSQRQPFYSEVLNTPEIRDPAKVRDFPNFICESEPGDVVAFNLIIWHASHGGKRARPNIQAHYYGYPRSAEHVEDVRDQYDSNRRNAVRYALKLNEEPDYYPMPRRSEWLERMREFGFFDKDNDTYAEELKAG